MFVFEFVRVELNSMIVFILIPVLSIDDFLR